jgi:hypothetical protein
MPEKKTIERAKKALRSGKAPSTAAGEFIREEIHHAREGKHGVRSAKQAIAIGLSKARRAGVPLPAEKPTRSTRAMQRAAKAGAPKRLAKRRKAQKAALRRGASKKAPSKKRAKAALTALKREPRRTVTRAALSRQAKTATKKRGPVLRKRAAKKAAKTRARTTGRS